MSHMRSSGEKPHAPCLTETGIMKHGCTGNHSSFTRCLAFLFALLAVAGSGSYAADTPPARTEQQIEVTLIHVDKYGVYAPNLVFYWDPGMNKQKVAALTGIAEQLRNKNAVITYATSSDITRDKRLVLVDIAALKRESPPAADSPPPRDTLKPPVTGTEKAASPPPKDEPASDKEEPGPQRPVKEVELGQSKAASAGSTTITRAEVTQFIQDCMDAVRNKDIERSLGCYGEEVDYYLKGTVNRDFIRKDKGYYFRNWDKIQSSLDGDVVLIVIDQPDLKIAKFHSRFYVENAKSRASGRAENIWKIQRVGNELKIVDEKQRIIERD